MDNEKADKELRYEMDNEQRKEWIVMRTNEKMNMAKMIMMIQKYCKLNNDEPTDNDWRKETNEKMKWRRKWTLLIQLWKVTIIMTKMKYDQLMTRQYWMKDKAMKKEGQKTSRKTSWPIWLGIEEWPENWVNVKKTSERIAWNENEKKKAEEDNYTMIQPIILLLTIIMEEDWW